MIHMKKNHWLARLAGLMLVSYTLLVVGVMASGTAGTQSDPLVTVSYLNETFMAQMLGKVDEKLTARDKELSDRLSAQVAADTKELANKYGAGDGGEASGSADTFVVVTLTKGQTLNGEIGCEVMLRVGTASCVASSAPGLVDETGGTTIDNGAKLTTNHLYMMTISGRGVTATAATVKLLVRGGYTIV